MTLATSVSHYRLENNRKYHTYREPGIIYLLWGMAYKLPQGDGSYWVPHDKEAVKLDTIAYNPQIRVFTIENAMD